MGIFQIALILATFLCSLVAGFLFAFALVTMPGIRLGCWKQQPPTHNGRSPVALLSWRPTPQRVRVN